MSDDFIAAQTREARRLQEPATGREEGRCEHGFLHCDSPKCDTPPYRRLDGREEGERVERERLIEWLRATESPDRILFFGYDDQPFTERALLHALAPSVEPCKDGWHMILDSQTFCPTCGSSEKYKGRAERGKAEPLFVVLAPDPDSPNEVFVEIETAAGNSVRVPSHSAGGYRLVGPLFSAPSVEPEQAGERSVSAGADGSLMIEPALTVYVVERTSADDPKRTVTILSADEARALLSALSVEEEPRGYEVVQKGTQIQLAIFGRDAWDLAADRADERSYVRPLFTSPPAAVADLRERAKGGVAAALADMERCETAEGEAYCKGRLHAYRAICDYESIEPPAAVEPEGLIAALESKGFTGFDANDIADLKEVFSVPTQVERLRELYEQAGGHYNNAINRGSDVGPHYWQGQMDAYNLLLVALSAQEEPK